MRDPMPEVLEVDYLATYEWVLGEDGPEQTAGAGQTFVETLYTRLQPIFPNADITVRLDGVQYATRPTFIVIDDTLIGEDEHPNDVISWAEYLCDEEAQAVAAECFTWETDSDDEQLAEDNFHYGEMVAAGLGLR